MTDLRAEKGGVETGAGESKTDLRALRGMPPAKGLLDFAGVANSLFRATTGVVRGRAGVLVLPVALGRLRGFAGGTGAALRDAAGVDCGPVVCIIPAFFASFSFGTPKPCLLTCAGVTPT